MTPLGPVTTQDRTYGVYYIPDVSGHANHDQVVYAHPNGLCVVCLAEMGEGEELVRLPCSDVTEGAKPCAHRASPATAASAHHRHVACPWASCPVAACLCSGTSSTPTASRAGC